MTDTAAADWSPADNPYAIAVSEAHWWLLAAKLAIARIRDGDDPRTAFSSRQIDARQLVVALCQVLVAEQLEQSALRALGIDQSVRDALSQARQRFEADLPGVKHMRDALTHFDEWSRGTGLGPQRESRQAGQADRDVARAYWRFAYDPNADTISLGPYTIHVDTADNASTSLFHAINLAAHQVDARNTADLRARTVQAITTAGIPCGSPDDTIHISLGTDTRIWVSLASKAGSDKYGDSNLPTRIVAALTSAGLHLVSHAHPENQEPTELLTQGHPLQVEARHTTSDPVSHEQNHEERIRMFRQLVDIALVYHDEAEACAHAGCHHAACLRETPTLIPEQAVYHTAYNIVRTTFNYTYAYLKTLSQIEQQR